MATPSRERQLIDNVWKYQTVEESGGGGGTPTLADVLTESNDGAGIGFVNTGTIFTGDSTIDTGTAAIAQGDGDATANYQAANIDQDDGQGATTNVAAGSVSLETGTTSLFLAPNNAAVIRAKPQATTGVALSVNAGNSPAACIDPNGVPLISADSRPEIAAIATAQGIVNALLALGIVTQAS